MHRFLLVLGWIGVSSAFTGYSPESFPDSMTQQLLCNQDTPTLLCDPTSQLAQGKNITENYQRINQKLAALRYNTTCKCGPTDSNLGKCDSIGAWGFTASVAILDSMILDVNQHGRDDVLRAIEEFAHRLRRRFPRGNCDDDVYIVLSVKDDAIWTSAGKVAERYLTPELVNTITITAEQYFKKKQYTDGLVYMIEEYNKVFNEEKVETVESTGWDWPIPKWVVIVLGVIVGLVIIGLLACAIYCLAKCCCLKDRRGNYSTVNRGNNPRPAHL
ncbi:unnamed protein product, partial [Mesorhabditis belari]|uniref:Uncharacterized protein n=1 Tax=Mesorhabditis belari TaxID=2138241 RepID=A0AAF3FDE9_9BILA